MKNTRLYRHPVNNFDMILFQKLCTLCYLLSRIHMLFFLIGHICQYFLLSSLNSNRKCQLIVDKSWLNNSPQNSCVSAFAKNSFFFFSFPLGRVQVAIMQAVFNSWQRKVVYLRKWQFYIRSLWRLTTGPLWITMMKKKLTTERNIVKTI